ncbi:MAG: glycosyltransferase family 39 protein [Myxococcota bacterium]
MIAFGAWARVEGLGRDLVWHDEVYTRVFVAGWRADDWRPALWDGEVHGVEEVRRLQRLDPARSTLDTVRGLARDEPQHPPVYYVLARLWTTALGDDVATLRLASALPGLLAIPAAAWACHVLFGRAGVAGALLVAASPFFVLYAREAREYALWGLLTFASTAALIRAARAPGVGAWALYATITTLSLYTSFSTATVLLAHGVWALFHRRAWPGCVAAWSAALLAFSPWGLALLRNLDAFRASMAWSREIVVPRGELLGALAVNASRVILDLGDAGVVAGGALAAGAVVHAVRRAPRDAGLMIGALVVVPTLFLLVPDLVSGGIRSISTRYLTPAWVGVVLALAFSLPRAGLAGVLGLMLASHTREVAPWTKGISRRLPEAAAVVNAAPRPLVVGDRERHNPGNVLALAGLLRDDAELLLFADAEGHALPRADGVFLFTPTEQLRRAVEARHGVTTRLVVDDLHLQLWEVVQGP